MYVLGKLQKNLMDQDPNRIACNCGNRFIKSIHFEEIDVANDILLNKKIKNDFYHFINCYAYRRMNYVKRYLSPDVIYSKIELTQSHDLYVYANKYLIEELKEVIKKFDNVEFLVHEKPFNETESIKEEATAVV